MKGNIDILIVSERKIDYSFAVVVIDGFSKPYRLDRDNNGGGIMLYVREDIASNLLPTDEKNHIESCSYNPNKTMICSHLNALSTYLDLHSTTYEKDLILGDFNVGIEEQL